MRPQQKGQEAAAVAKTADLADRHPGLVQACVAPWRKFGRRAFFGGPIATVKTFEDAALIRRCVEQPGEGRVLVIDAGGSLRAAVFGDVLAGIALARGWSGVIVHGAIRDAEELDRMDFAVMALGAVPVRGGKTGVGETDVPVRFGDVLFVPGRHLYADRDGVLVSRKALPPPGAGAALESGVSTPPAADPQ